MDPGLSYKRSCNAGKLYTCDVNLTREKEMNALKSYFEVKSLKILGGFFFVCFFPIRFVC